MDIKILANDKTVELIARFHAFPEIDKFNRAKNIVSFCDDYPNNTKLDDSIQRTFINKPGRQQSIHQTILKYGGKDKKGNPSCPKHWTGKSVRKRAHDLGFKYEELYVKAYSLLSWYIHSGSTGYVELNEKDIENCFVYCHSLAQEMFLEVTVICAEEMEKNPFRIRRKELDYYIKIILER